MQVVFSFPEADFYGHRLSLVVFRRRALAAAASRQVAIEISVEKSPKQVDVVSARIRTNITFGLIPCRTRFPQTVRAFQEQEVLVGIYADTKLTGHSDDFRGCSAVRSSSPRHKTVEEKTFVECHRVERRWTSNADATRNNHGQM